VLWWVEEDVGEFGGARTRLNSARIGRNCSATPLGAPRSLDRYNDDTFFSSFSIDGSVMYFGNLALPLAELG
jgi:hypothetical protein